MAAQSVDVIIVGAGAAGLTAGYDLHFDTSHTYKILEASSVVGGRLRKMPPGFADFPIDIGGEWIHAEPPILDTIYGDPNEKPTDYIETVPYVETYDWYEDGEWSPEPFPTTDYKYVNYTWFDYINDWIASGVMENVVLECQVISVDWSSSPVKVSCADGRQWTAPHVIMTASIGVLQNRDIPFTPALPDRTLAAIDEYYFMPGLKTFLKFSEPFDREAFEIASDFEEGFELFGARYFYNVGYGQTTNDNVLGVFAVGESADKFIVMSDEELFDNILQQLDGIYDGLASSYFIEGFNQNWNNEQFVKGAYTWLPDDYDSLSAVDVMRESLEDKIFFAGEAVPPNDYEYGFAHNACKSGRAAAQKIIPLLAAGPAPAPGPGPAPEPAPGPGPAPGPSPAEPGPAPAPTPEASTANHLDWSFALSILALLFAREL